MERALKTAGMAMEPGIMPGSIAAAYGRHLWEQTGDLRLARQALGHRSLDATANEIGLQEDDLPTDADAMLRAAVLGENGRGEINAMRGGARHPNPTPAPAAAVQAAPTRVKVKAFRIETDQR